MPRSRRSSSTGLSGRRGGPSPLVMVFVAAFCAVGVAWTVWSLAAPEPGAHTKPRKHWIIAEDAAVALAANQPIGAQFARQINNASTYEILDRRLAGSANPLPNAVKVETYGDYNAIAADLSNHTVLPGVTMIQYDAEHWDATPLTQQQSPYPWTKRVATLVHANHYQLMVTPGADLKGVLEPQAANQYTAYVGSKERLAGLAKFADVFEIQAQNAASVWQYNWFAGKALAQARQANPKIPVLLGVTAKVGGPSAQNIVTEYTTNKRASDGFWLNIPSTYSGSNSGVPIALPLCASWYKL